MAQHLKQSGLEPVFIGGGGDDFSPFRAFRAVAGAPLSEIKRLLAGASLFVGNDSGPAHMAAAFGVPAVVIFGASDPAIWGPWRTVSEVVTAPSRRGARSSTRWRACGCPHDGTAAAAGLRPPLLGVSGGIRGPDGRGGRRHRHDGAADRSHLRQSAQRLRGQYPGQAVHRPDLPPQLLSRAISCPLPFTTSGPWWPSPSWRSFSPRVFAITSATTWSITWGSPRSPTCGTRCSTRC